MKKKIILAILMMGSLAFLPGRALAVEIGQDEICNKITDEVQREAAGCDKQADGGEIGNAMQNVINVVIAVLGIVAVLFVVIGAAQYMISQGDPGKYGKVAFLKKADPAQKKAQQHNGHKAASPDHNRFHIPCLLSKILYLNYTKYAHILQEEELQIKIGKKCIKTIVHK